MGTPSQVLAGLPQQWQVGLLLALLPVLVLSSYLVLSSSRRRDDSTLRLPPGPRRLPVCWATSTFWARCPTGASGSWHGNMVP
ncbi:unnamed protein product [Urochloa humidicola]